MKRFFKRGTSVLLALVMLFSVLTTSVMAVITKQNASAADTEAGLTAEAGKAPDIDFYYADKYGITTAEQAKTNAANSKYAFNNGTADSKKLYETISSNYKWRHVGRRDVFTKSADEKLKEFSKYAKSLTRAAEMITGKEYENYCKYWQRYENRVGYHSRDVAFNEFGYYMESTAEEDQNIVLDTDFTYHNIWYLPGSIKITSPKVLDLNGHNIYLNDVTNRAFRSGKQNDHEYAHYSRMFEITGNGSLTIIDSSETRNGEGKGTGAIYTNNYMTDPFGTAYNFYTSRDIFWVDGGGKLIVYGGTFQAGRSKDQQESGFTWENVKKVIGSAVELGVNIGEYVYGIKGAKAALNDLQDSFAENAVEAVAEPDGSGTGTPKSTGGSTTKKDGSAGVKETKAKIPNMDKDRNKAVGEKTSDKNKATKEDNDKYGTNKPLDPENKANDKNSAKEENAEGKKAEGKKDGKNTQLVNAEKEIFNAATDEKKISNIATEALDLIDGIVNLFRKTGPRLTQSTLGTVAHVGNNGTFVSYGGTFIGFGSTANTRNATIEVSETLGSNNAHFVDGDFDSKYNGGLAYIYGGNFEGRTGANIFNIVNKNTSYISGRYQTIKDASGNASKEPVTIAASEIYGGEPISIYNDKPVDTRNIVVRGGNFNCSAELSMAGTWQDGKITMFPGTKGYMNLGIESYNPDYIKDGRIQIRDTYGDGELVLLDETKDDNEQIHHYRLFCSELELRYNTNLQVYPGNPDSNTTHSFRLFSTNKDASKDLSELVMSSWKSDDKGSERNSAFADNEQYFEYPVNSDEGGVSGHYYIMPSTSRTSTDVKGEKFAGSSMWYYSTPLDPNGKPIETSFEDSDLYNFVRVYNDNGTQVDAVYSHRNDPLYNANLSDSRYQLQYQGAESNSFAASTKWIHYKVYRVDPLTRENISEGNRYGEDVPLADIVYGASNDSLNCKLNLRKLEAYMKEKWGNTKDRYGNYHFRGFKGGEMYRVVFTVDEDLSFNYYHNIKTKKGEFTKSLDTAKMTSSILFTCFDEMTEKKENPNPPKDPLTGELDTSLIPDFTPLQWIDEPAVDTTAAVKITNAKAAQTDYTGRKIFDVYYQWYTVDKDGKETLLAGTTDIYKGDSEEQLSYHTISGINEKTANKDGGYKYVNTLTPDQKKSGKYDEFGMPKGDKKNWSYTDFHAYAYWFMNEGERMSVLFGGSSEDGLRDNYPYVFKQNTDKCYIPEEAAGKDVYCKAIVVNTYWPLNYDHIQVFTSHKVHIPEAEYCTVKVATSLDNFTDEMKEYKVLKYSRFTLPEAVESNNLYDFGGWANGVVAGSTKLGDPGDKITITRDCRIFAVKKDKAGDATPKITFKAGEGSGTMSEAVLDSRGATYRFPKSTFTAPAGKAFYRWKVVDSTGNEEYLREGDYTKIYYATTATAEYKGSFNVWNSRYENSNDASMYKIATVNIGDEYTLPSIPTAWIRNGEQIAFSWNLGTPGTKIKITDDTPNDRRGIIHLYPAYHDIGELSVTYDANGGTFNEQFGGGRSYTVKVTEDSLDVAHNLRFITEDGLIRDGYEFLGWSIGSDDKIYKPGEKFYISGATTVRAQWKEISPPAQNWHSEFDRATGTLTIVGTGVISPSDGSYFTGLSDDVTTTDLKHLVFTEGITEINKPICGNEFKTVKFPSTLEKIGAYAFGPQSGSLPWVKEIDIPASVKTIGPYAFCMNASFEKVTLHEGLEEIAKNAFSGCDGLTEITVPDSVKRLGRFAFGSEGNRYFCDKQEVIPGLIDSQADRFYDGFVIKCSKDSLAQEYAIKYGFNYDNGESKPAPVTNDKIKYTVDTKTKTITVTGTGPIPDYNYYNAPWSREKADEYCRKLVIGEGITSIGKYAFAGMCITEVQFPSTLKKIDDYAFMGCDVLGCKDGITFPDSLESIGTAAFRYVGAKTINFGSGVKSIGAYAFCDRMVYRIETIYPDGYDPYEGVTGIAYAYEVEIPDNVETIGDYAFGYYNTYTMDWRYSPYTLEAPLSNRGEKDEKGNIKTLTIVTPKGSAAYNYALANGFKTSTTTSVNYICIGDLNYNGYLDNGDLERFDSYFFYYVENDVESYNVKAETADVNRDGKIDKTDRDLLQECLESNDKFTQYIKPIRVLK